MFACVGVWVCCVGVWVGVWVCVCVCVWVCVRVCMCVCCIILYGTKIKGCAVTATYISTAELHDALFADHPAWASLSGIYIYT